MVLNALRKESHISHFTLDEAVAMVQELGVPVGIFYPYQSPVGRHEEINAELPKGIELAYDGINLF